MYCLVILPLKPCQANISPSIAATATINMMNGLIIALGGHFHGRA